jgi:protein-arginine kinase activator protein McsA
MKNIPTSEGSRCPWQHRGRCGECGTKYAGFRRTHRCGCGGRVIGW